MHEDVAFLKAGLLRHRVRTILTDVVDVQRELFLRQAFRGALFIREIDHVHAAKGHRAHRPGADAFGDVRLHAPAARQHEGDILRAATALHRGFQTACGRCAMHHMAEIGRRNQRLAFHGHDFISGLQSGLRRDAFRCHFLHFRDLIGCELQSKHVWRRMRIDELQRHRTALRAMMRAHRIADHVAVHAALHDLAFPIELAAVFRGEGRKLHRRAKRRRDRLFARQRGFVARIAFVNVQRGLQRFLETAHGFVQRVLLMRPRAETAINGAIAIEDDARERQIVVKLEAREVQRVRIDHPHAHKLVQQRLQRLILQNARVHARARHARHAAQHYQQRFSGRFGQAEARVDVVVVPARIILQRRLVATHSALAIFDGFSGASRRQQRQQAHQDKRRLHTRRIERAPDQKVTPKITPAAFRASAAGCPTGGDSCVCSFRPRTSPRDENSRNCPRPSLSRPDRPRRC